jgi:hypothetical protein
MDNAASPEHICPDERIEYSVGFKARLEELNKPVE